MIGTFLKNASELNWNILQHRETYNLIISKGEKVKKSFPPLMATYLKTVGQRFTLMLTIFCLLICLNHALLMSDLV